MAIINTCTVTGEADAKNRKAIRSLLRACDAPIILTGCAINIDKDHYADIDQRVICESDKSRVAQLACELVKASCTSPAPDTYPTSSEDPPCAIDIRNANPESFRTRVDLKIQDGCNSACSYCIVHVARGPARSIPSARVIATAKEFAAHGIKELVLVGIDLAAYREGELDLAQLIEAIQTQTCIGRVRISSVEPQSVTPSLIDLLAHSDGRICRHLHLCLQSGSSKVLREMNRHYDAEQFETLARRLRNACPSIALSTDVIVGFPGESDEDFRQTCELVERCGFMRLHVFRYSKRPGTPAAERLDQVDPRTMAKRSETLIALGRRLAFEDMQRRLGTVEQVVIERPGVGTSESYHTVLCDPTLPVGTLVTLELADIDEAERAFLGR